MLLGAAAVVRRAWWGLSAVIVAAMVWSAVFVPQMLPATVPGGPAQLTVATQNIGAANTDPLAAAQALVASGAGIVAVQEIVGSGDATAVLDAAVRLPRPGQHRRALVANGRWTMPEPLELGMGWARSFRVVVHHPEGDIAVYAVHLPSVRPGYTDARDRGRRRTGRAGRRRSGRAGCWSWAT